MSSEQKVEIRREGEWTRRFVSTDPNDIDNPDKMKEQDYPDGSPSVQHEDGSFEYRQNGILHREGGLPASIFYWDQNGDGNIVEYYEYRVEGRLHRVDGAAVTSPLQDPLYVFFGENVPKEWTEPGGLTPDAILKEQNPEKRRVGVQVYGLDKFVEETTVETLDADIADRNDTRALVTLKDDTRWMICTDGSTGRIYHLRVPDDVNTCAEAYKRLTSLDDDKCVASG